MKLLGLALVIVLIVQMLSGIVASFGVFSPLRSVVFLSLSVSEICAAVHKFGSHCIFALLYIHLIKKIFKCSYRSYRIVWMTGVIAGITLLALAVTGQLLKMDSHNYWFFVVIAKSLSHLPFLHSLNKKILPQDINLLAIFYIHIALSLLVCLPTIGHFYFMSNALKHKLSLIISKWYAWLKDGHFWAIIGGLAGYIFLSIALCYSNYMPPDPNFTPSDISPMWYLRPFYMVLIYIYDPLWAIFAIVCMFLAIFILPISERIVVRDRNFVILTGLWVAALIVPSLLGVLGASYSIIRITGIVSLTYYFLYFLIIIPRSLYKKLM